MTKNFRGRVTDYIKGFFFRHQGPCNHTLYTGIIIFPHIDKAQSIEEKNEWEWNTKTEGTN